MYYFFLKILSNEQFYGQQNKINSCLLFIYIVTTYKYNNLIVMLCTPAGL